MPKAYVESKTLNRTDRIIKNKQFYKHTEVHKHQNTIVYYINCITRSFILAPLIKTSSDQKSIELCRWFRKAKCYLRCYNNLKMRSKQLYGQYGVRKMAFTMLKIENGDVNIYIKKIELFKII